jgi:iron complex transport system ATP-binding protein
MIEKNLLHTENLQFGYKKPLTEPSDLSTEQGDIVCIIGRNGCGKSTLLNTITGIKPVISGKIFLNKIDLNKISLSERSKLISFVPSKPEYLSNLTVVELASMGRSPYTNVFDTKSEYDNKIIDTCLSDFNLTELKNRPLWSLSDGERQRATICRAVIQETPVIVLDEPTAFLDYYVRQKLLSDLKSLAENKKICIIFSSHDIEIAARFATKIWYFNNEKIEIYNATEFINKGILQGLTAGFNEKSTIAK